jgi:hypothetical protein
MQSQTAWGVRRPRNHGRAFLAWPALLCFAYSTTVSSAIWALVFAWPIVTFKKKIEGRTFFIKQAFVPLPFLESYYIAITSMIQKLKKLLEQ